MVHLPVLEVVDAVLAPPIRRDVRPCAGTSALILDDGLVVIDLDDPPRSMRVLCGESATSFDDRVDGRSLSSESDADF